MSVKEIEKMLKADSLAYLSSEAMLGVFGEDSGSFCTACFDGDYPVEHTDVALLQQKLFDGGK